MKHIKKTYRVERPLTKEEEDDLSKKFPAVKLDNIRKKPPTGMIPILICEREGGNVALGGFFYSRNGIHYAIPEPDPVLIYFHTAYLNWKVIKEKEKELLNKLIAPPINEGISNELYEHFSVCITFATSLFICIEAFINSLIPNNYVYQDAGSRNTVSYNKDQIQEFLPFDTKIKKVIQQITGKNHDNKPQMRQHIVNLKEFRDMVVHTKMRSGGATPYEYLFHTVLNFKYEATLHAARDFINHYKPGYIVECDCGVDF